MIREILNRLTELLARYGAAGVAAAFIGAAFAIYCFDRALTTPVRRWGGGDE